MSVKWAAKLGPACQAFVLLDCTPSPALGTNCASYLIHHPKANHGHEPRGHATTLQVGAPDIGEDVGSMGAWQTGLEIASSVGKASKQHGSLGSAKRGLNANAPRDT